MPDRAAFLGSVAGAATSIVVSAGGHAHGPTPPARAQAEAMRRFDPHLTDAQIETIARGIDAGVSAGRALTPGGKALRNGDAPVSQLHLDLVP